MSMRLRMWALVAVSTLGFALPAAAQDLTSLRLPTERDLGRYGLEMAWSANAVINSSRDEVQYVVVDEESIFIQTRAGFITALDAETGDRRWSGLLGRLDTPTFPVAANSDTLLVAAGIRLFAVSKWNGDLLWEIVLPEQAGSTPAVDERRVYLTTSAGSVYAYDLARIYELYHAGSLPESLFRAQLWRHRTSKAVAFSPVVVVWEDIEISSQPIIDVIFASRTGVLYGVAAGDHKLTFQMETSEPISAPLGKLENKVFLVSQNQHVYCIDVPSRSLDWEFVSRAPIRAAPRIIDRRCYLTPTDGTLYCVNADTGGELWRTDEAREFLGKTANYVFASDSLGNIMLLQPNEAEGTAVVTGRLPLKQFSIRGNNELTNRIYMSTPTGVVVALREKGSGFPLYYKNPADRPIEPLVSEPAPANVSADAPATPEAP